MQKMPSFHGSESIARWMISAVFVLFSQLTLVSVHRFFSTLSIPAQLSISAAVLLVTTGIGGWCRRFAGVSASAPAFVVFNILFVWSVYMVLVRRDVSVFMDVLFNLEVALMIIGLYSMFTSDPGKVAYGSSTSSQFAESKAETTALAGRIRLCKSCKAYIKGFDHHCPAFGNCIGQNNYFLFMVLLIGFLFTEGSFVLCSYQFVAKSQASLQARSDIMTRPDIAISTMLFCLLQLPWQGLFLAWHVYCICANITTDEWVNWTRYPEFWLHTESEDDPEQDIVIKRFQNPYDKGILRNVKEFLFVAPKQ